MKSRRLIYKIRNFVTSGFEIYAIWVECLVNKLSQIQDTSYCSPNKVREMVTHLGTHLFIKDNANVCTMLIKCVGNHYVQTLFKSVQIVKSYLSYAV